MLKDKEVNQLPSKLHRNSLLVTKSARPVALLCCEMVSCFHSCVSPITIKLCWILCNKLLDEVAHLYRLLCSDISRVKWSNNKEADAQGAVDCKDRLTTEMCLFKCSVTVSASSPVPPLKFDIPTTVLSLYNQKVALQVVLRQKEKISQQ